MKARMVCGVLLFSAGITGCGQTQAAASWAFDLVKWHGHTYRVTADHIRNVGKQIGVITRYSTDERDAESGTFSNKFPVGTKLFEISGVDTDSAIAVEESDGSFVQAVGQG